MMSSTAEIIRELQERRDCLDQVDQVLKEANAQIEILQDRLGSQIYDLNRAITSMRSYEERAKKLAEEV